MNRADLNRTIFNKKTFYVMSVHTPASRLQNHESCIVILSAEIKLVETETACIGNDELEQFAIKSIVGWIQDGLMMLGGLMIDGYIVEVGWIDSRWVE